MTKFLNKELSIPCALFRRKTLRDKVKHILQELTSRNRSQSQSVIGVSTSRKRSHAVSNINEYNDGPLHNGVNSEA